MFKLLFCLVFFISINCTKLVLAADPEKRVVIKIVDEKNLFIKADTVEWWYTEGSQQKYKLKCQQKICSEWIIKQPLMKSIKVRALASLVKENDAYCWDLFEGEREVLSHQKEVNIPMLYKVTVCK